MAETVFYDVHTALYDIVALDGAIRVGVNDPSIATGMRGDAGEYTQYNIDAGYVDGVVTFKDVVVAGLFANKHEEDDLTVRVKNHLGVLYLMTFTSINSAGISAMFATPAEPVSVAFKAQAFTLAAVV